jgi:hypothetical protein
MDKFPDFWLMFLTQIAGGPGSGIAHVHHLDDLILNESA